MSVVSTLFDCFYLIIFLAIVVQVLLAVTICWMNNYNF